MAVWALPRPLRLTVLSPDRPPLSPTWSPGLWRSTSETVNGLLTDRKSVLEMITHLSAVTVAARSESVTGSMEPSGEPMLSRLAVRSKDLNIIWRLNKDLPPSLISLTWIWQVFGLSSAFWRLLTTEVAMAWCQSVIRGLPLRAQFRILTGFPCSIFPAQRYKKRGKPWRFSSVVAGVGPIFPTFRNPISDLRAFGAVFFLLHI